MEKARPPLGLIEGQKAFFVKYRFCKSLLLSLIYVIIFLTFYYFVFRTFFAIYGNGEACGPASYTAVFLTSPINFCENFSHDYSSAQEGFISNGITVAIIIFIASFYSDYTEIALKRYLSFGNAAAVSVAASYLLSGLTWFNSGVPSSGTSIIGFNLTLFLALGLLADWHHMKKNKVAYVAKLSNSWYAHLLSTRLKVSIKVGILRTYNTKRLLLGWGAIATTLFIPFLYLFSNGSYALHLSGGFVLLLFLYLRTGWHLTDHA